MEVTPQNNSQDAESFGTVPQAAEAFRNVPNASEPFRTVRNDSESFRTVPYASERKENHSLTVREAARMFEVAGVARTERSITNWCRMNAQGIARLEAYYDPNERKYYITPQSVELAIAEEKAKAAKTNAASESVGSVRNDSERTTGDHSSVSETDTEQVQELEKQLMDLKITNRAKDFVINQFQKEREGFAVERKEFIAQLVTANRRLGELETQLQLVEPASNGARRLKVWSDGSNSESATSES